MRLSEAIRLGATMKPQHFGMYRDVEGKATCAMGAAFDAIGEDTWITGWDETNRSLNLGKCPECRGFVVGNLIVHLNDNHRWSRERIADFVELHEPLTLSEPLPLPEKDSVEK